MRALPLAACLLILSATAASAQAGGAKIPRRPRLPAGADTSDAFAYYQLGLSAVGADPEQAAAAFYWARRLQPDAAVVWYSERVARLLASPDLLQGYFEDDRRTLQSAEMKQLDTLEIRALSIDPFIPRQLDELLVMTYVTNSVHDELRRHGEEVSTLDIQYYVQSALHDAGPEESAELAFGQGQYRMAADLWSRAARHHRKDGRYRMWRARALFLLGELDSAHVELDSGLATARRSDAEKMKFVYDSKAMWQYEVGRILEMQGRDSAAREAYQQALVEDLSFYPAHARLASVAMRTGDTATALTELQRAVEIKDDDFASQLGLGTVLASRRDTAKAAEHLRRAAEIEPWVPQPHLVLGDARRVAGDRDGAVTEYRRFLALAARRNGDYETVRARLAALGAPVP